MTDTQNLRDVLAEARRSAERASSSASDAASEASDARDYADSAYDSASSAESHADEVQEHLDEIATMVDEVIAENERLTLHVGLVRQHVAGRPADGLQARCARALLRVVSLRRQSSLDSHVISFENPRPARRPFGGATSRGSRTRGTGEGCR